MLGGFFFFYSRLNKQLPATISAINRPMSRMFSSLIANPLSISNSNLVTQCRYHLGRCWHQARCERSRYDFLFLFGFLSLFNCHAALGDRDEPQAGSYSTEYANVPQFLCFSTPSEHFAGLTMIS
jgi:hypothetical protein